MWKRGKCKEIDYMQYDNAVLPVLREEPGWCSWYSCWLQAEWSGDRISWSLDLIVNGCASERSSKLVQRV